MGLQRIQGFSGMSYSVYAGGLIVANGCTRSIMHATRLVYSHNFGIMMVPSSLCRPMGAWNRILINTATRKLSVSTRIGTANYPNSHPCKIVFVNGNLVS